MTHMSNQRSLVGWLGMEAVLSVCVTEPADLHPGGLDTTRPAPSAMSVGDARGRGQ